jgi:shikimate kinase
MALYGPEGYRHLERQSLERVVATYDRLILAVAGGIVSQPETYNYLLRNFHTIWLKAEPEEHMARVRRQGDERPMAGNPDAMAELRNILTAREALYARAEVHINTSKTTPEKCLEAILDAIAKKRFVAVKVLSVELAEFPSAVVAGQSASKTRGNALTSRPPRFSRLGAAPPYTAAALYFDVRSRRDKPGDDDSDVIQND